jgi:protein-tyrosine phosphatase
METLKMLHDQGYYTVICTPHISALYPNSESRIQQKYDELKETLLESSLNITLLYGAEYNCETLYEKIIHNKPVLYINPDNHSKKYILIEFPSFMKLLWLDKMLENLTKNNIGVIIAHPERCNQIDMFKEITHKCDCIFAINGSSVLGNNGERVKNNAFSIINQHSTKIVFTSDTHPSLHRYPQLDSVKNYLQKIYSQVVINYWFRTLPEIIINDIKISQSEEKVIQYYADSIQ